MTCSGWLKLESPWLNNADLIWAIFFCLLKYKQWLQPPEKKVDNETGFYEDPETGMIVVKVDGKELCKVPAGEKGKAKNWQWLKVVIGTSIIKIEHKLPHEAPSPTTYPPKFCRRFYCAETEVEMKLPFWFFPQSRLHA